MLEPSVYAVDCHIGAWGMPQHMTIAGGGVHSKHPPTSGREGGEGGNNGAGGGGTSFLWGWLIGMLLSRKSDEQTDIGSTH